MSEARGLDRFRAILAIEKAVQCPTCDAAKGSPCVGPSPYRRPRVIPHDSRRRAFLPTVAKPCMAYTNEGLNCMRITRHESGLCGLHRDRRQQ